MPVAKTEYSRYFALMTITDQLRLVVQAYVDRSGLPLSRLSHRVFAESKLLPLFMDGRASMTLTRADQGLAWFSLNWPEDADWPEGVPRPAATSTDVVPSARTEG